MNIYKANIVSTQMGVAFGEDVYIVAESNSKAVRIAKSIVNETWEDIKWEGRQAVTEYDNIAVSIERVALCNSILAHTEDMMVHVPLIPPATKKLFVMNLRTRSGDEEHDKERIILAESHEDAYRIADDWLSDLYGEGCVDEDGVAWTSDDCMATEIRSVNPYRIVDAITSKDGCEDVEIVAIIK
jgi:hypothetical protein